MNPLADINPKNRPYIRRVNAAKQPLGDSVLPNDKRSTVGEIPGGPNRRERRWETRWAVRPRNKNALAKHRKNQALTGLKPKRYTMVPGAPPAPKKRRGFLAWIAEFFRILTDRSIPWSKRGLRG